MKDFPIDQRKHVCQAQAGAPGREHRERPTRFRKISLESENLCPPAKKLVRLGWKPKNHPWVLRWTHKNLLKKISAP